MRAWEVLVLTNGNPHGITPAEIAAGYCMTEAYASKVMRPLQSF
jgi:hypothetical protein